MSTPKLRLATPTDGAALSSIYAPFVTGDATSFELEPPGAEEMGRRVEKLVQRTPWLVCEAAEEVIGYAYASPHRDRAAYQWSVEVSAYVRADARRAGVARTLYTSLFALLDAQGFHRAYAGITVPNATSVGFHAALGFTPVGVYRGVGFKMGAWRDVAWFDRPLGAEKTDPAPPTPLPALMGGEAWGAAIAAGEHELARRRLARP